MCIAELSKEKPAFSVVFAEQVRGWGGGGGGADYDILERSFLICISKLAYLRNPSASFAVKRVCNVHRRSRQRKFISVGFDHLLSAKIVEGVHVVGYIVCLLSERCKNASPAVVFAQMQYLLQFTGDGGLGQRRLRRGGGWRAFAFCSYILYTPWS